MVSPLNVHCLTSQLTLSPPLLSTQGGAMAIAFAERFPALVRSLFLIAPAGLPSEQPLAARLLTMPAIGGMLFALAGKASLIKHVENGR